MARKVKRKRPRTNLTLSKSTRRMLLALENGHRSRSRVVDKAVYAYYMRKKRRKR